MGAAVGAEEKGSIQPAGLTVSAAKGTAGSATLVERKSLINGPTRGVGLNADVKGTIIPGWQCHQINPPGFLAVRVKYVMYTMVKNRNPKSL